MHESSCEKNRKRIPVRKSKGKGVPQPGAAAGEVHLDGGGGGKCDAVGEQVLEKEQIDARVHRALFKYAEEFGLYPVDNEDTLANFMGKSDIRRVIQFTKAMYHKNN